MIQQEIRTSRDFAAGFLWGVLGAVFFTVAIVVILGALK